MTPDVQPVRALYYPRIQFGSMGWVKAALLYWEGLVRIVPEGFGTEDPPDIYELGAAGLIENVSPAPYQGAATTAFLKRLEDVLRLWNVLSPCLEGERSLRKLRKYHLIRAGELDAGLLKELQAYGLAAAADGWVTMSSEIAELYKITLALEIANQRHAAITTDDPRCDAAAAYFARQKLTGEPTPATLVDGYHYARTIEPFPSLEHADVPVHQALRFRHRYSEERRAFRELVQAKTSYLATLPTVDAIDSHLRDFTAELKNEADAQRSTLRAARARDTWKLLGIGTPASLGAIVTFAGAPPVIAALGGIGSVGAGVTDWILERRPGRQPATRYLVSLEGLAR
jgi:hypothetical protein